MKALAFYAVVILCLVIPSFSRGQAPAVKVYPPHATVEGKTLGQWGDEWWKLVYSIPEGENPVKNDQTGQFAHKGQSGPVFFLYGNFGGKTERTCTVLYGKPIFFPILNDYENFPQSCTDCINCVATARSAMDTVSVLECEIDGVPVPDLWDHREASPDCFEFEVPENNCWKLPAGKYSPATSDGYWLMLEPLSLGSHVIHFRGVAGNPKNPAFSLDVTYNLEVVKFTVYPPHATVEGKTLGEWGDEWWKFAVSFPKDQSPLLDPDGSFCDKNPGGPVFFLYGNFGGKTERTCTVPCGKSIFFPIINDIEWFPQSCTDCPNCFAVAKQANDGTSVLECEIDGVPVPDLWDHREVSPECFEFEVPENNIYNIPAGKYSPAASDGYWLMLEPLSPGPHGIHFRGVIGDPQSPIFSLDMTYHLEVLSCGSRFRRGDPNNDGGVDLSDPIHILNYLFVGGEQACCPDAADTNDDGTIDLSDPIYLLDFMFRGMDPPPAPGQLNCGEDPTSEIPPLGECSCPCN